MHCYRGSPSSQLTAESCKLANLKHSREFAGKARLNELAFKFKSLQLSSGPNATCRSSMRLDWPGRGAALKVAPSGRKFETLSQVHIAIAKTQLNSDKHNWKAKLAR